MPPNVSPERGTRQRRVMPEFVSTPELETPQMDVVERPTVAGNEMKYMLDVLIALKRGDGTVRLPRDWTGVSGKVAEVFNDVVDQNERMTDELQRLSRVVGQEGKLRQRGSLGDARGFWRTSIDSVNGLIDDLVLRPARPRA